MIFSTLALHPQGVYLASLSINNRDRSPGLRQFTGCGSLNQTQAARRQSAVVVLYHITIYIIFSITIKTFNDALNTFYLRLYGIRHMVKDHSDSERGNPLLSCLWDDAYKRTLAANRKE